MRGTAALCLLVLAMAAGCADRPSPEGVDGEGAAAGGLSPLRWSYACLAGAEESGGVCTLHLSNPAESYQEPALALHPTEPGVWAVGYNAGQVANTESGGTQSALRLVLLVTEDGGQTWRRSEPPLPALSLQTAGGAVVSLSGDASMVFAPDGTLHVTGIYIPAASDSGGAVAPQFLYYARSMDLGRTWEPAQLPEYDARGEDDRNWASLGPDGRVWVTWHKYASGDHQVATIGADGTWTATRVEGCATPTPVLFLPEPTLACESYEEPGVQWRRIGAALEETLVSQVPAHESGGTGFPKVAVGGPLWVGVAGHNTASRQPLPSGLARFDGNDDTYTFMSRDAGATWDTFLLKERLASAGGWSFLAPRAIAVWNGEVHLLLEGGTEACLRGAACAQGEGQSGHRVVHAVLDSQGEVVHEQVLPTPAPPRAAPLLFDDFHDIAVDGDRLILAWAQDGVIGLTEVRAAV